MHELTKTYNNVFLSREVKKAYKVLPFIGKMNKEDGKETKILPKLEKMIGYSYDGRDRPKRKHRTWIEIMRDYYPNAVSKNYNNQIDNESDKKNN